MDVHVTEGDAADTHESMLLNIGLDLVTTDLVCVCPYCVNLELLPSFDTATGRTVEDGIGLLLQQLQSRDNEQPVAVVVPIFQDVYSNFHSPEYENVFSTCRDLNDHPLATTLGGLVSWQSLRAAAMRAKKPLEYTDKDGSVKKVSVRFKSANSSNAGRSLVEESDMFDRGMMKARHNPLHVPFSFLFTSRSTMTYLLFV